MIEFQKNRCWKNRLAVIVALIFTSQSVAFATPGTPPPNTASKQLLSVPIEQLIQNPSRLHLPLDFATLKELHVGKNGKLIIHIQDAHSNYSGQMNMAGAIEEMMTRTGIQTVLVEGSSKEVTFRETKKIADTKTWKIAANRLLLQGMISGEEYLNLTTDLPMRLMGIEYQELYDENLLSYSGMVEQRQKVLEYISVIERKIEVLKQFAYPRILTDYEKSKDSYGSDEFRSGYDKLIEVASRSGLLNQSAYPEIAKLEILKRLESEINFESANREQANLVATLKSKGLHEAVAQILEGAKKQPNSQSSHQGRLMGLINLAESAKISMVKYPHLMSYQVYLESFSELKIDQLLFEINQYEDDLYKKILTDQDSKRVRILDRYVELLRKAFEVKLSSDEFALLQVNRPDFKTIEWQAFMNRMILKDRDFEETVPFEDLIDNAYEELFKFYEVVSQRDLAFIKNSETILEKLDQNAAFLIAGGYHTAHLTQLLRQEGYSYVVLTPYVEFETDHQQYEKVLLQALDTIDSDEESGGIQTQNQPRNQDTVKILGVLNQISKNRLLQVNTFSIAPSRLSKALENDFKNNGPRNAPDEEFRIAPSRLSADESTNRLASDRFSVVSIGQTQSYVIDRLNQGVLDVLQTDGRIILRLRSLKPELVDQLEFEIDENDARLQQAEAKLSLDKTVLTLQSSQLPENSLFSVGRARDAIRIRSADKIRKQSKMSGKQLTLRLNTNGLENAGIKDGAIDENGNPTASRNGTVTLEVKSANSSDNSIFQSQANREWGGLPQFNERGKAITSEELEEFRILPGVTEDTVRILRAGSENARGQSVSNDVILRIYSNENQIIIRQVEDERSDAETIGQIVRFTNVDASGLVIGRSLEFADFQVRANKASEQNFISRQALVIRREGAEWVSSSSATNLPERYEDGEFKDFDQDVQYRLGGGIAGQLLRLRLLMQTNPNSLRNFNITAENGVLLLTGLFDQQGNFIRPATRQQIANPQFALINGHQFHTLAFNQRISRTAQDDLINISETARVNNLTNPEHPILVGLETANDQLKNEYQVISRKENKGFGGRVEELSQSRQIEILDSGFENLQQSIESFEPDEYLVSPLGAEDSFEEDGDFDLGSRLSSQASPGDIDFNQTAWPVIGSSLIFKRLTKFLASIEESVADLESLSDEDLEVLSLRVKKSQSTVSQYFRSESTLDQYPENTRQIINSTVSRFDAVSLRIQQVVYDRNPAQLDIDSMDLTERRWIEFIALIAQQGLTEHLENKVFELRDGAVKIQDTNPVLEGKALQLVNGLVLSEANLTPTTLRNYLALRDRYLQEGRSLDSEFARIRTAAQKLIVLGVLQEQKKTYFPVVLAKAVMDDLKRKDDELRRLAVSGVARGDEIASSEGERYRVISKTSEEIIVEAVNDFDTGFRETMALSPQAFRNQILNNPELRIDAFAVPQKTKIQIGVLNQYRFTAEETGFGSLRVTYKTPDSPRIVQKIFDQDQVVVGREDRSLTEGDLKNDIEFKATEISRKKHLFFERIDGQWFVSSNARNKPFLNGIQITEQRRPLFEDVQARNILDFDFAPQEESEIPADLTYASDEVLEKKNQLDAKVLDSWNLIQNVIRAVAGEVLQFQLRDLLSEEVPDELIISPETAKAFLKIRSDFVQTVANEGDIENHPFKTILDEATKIRPEIRNLKQEFFRVKLLDLLEAMQPQGSRLAYSDPLAGRRQAAENLVTQLRSEFEGITDLEIIEAYQAPDRGFADKLKARFDSGLKRAIEIQNRVRAMNVPINDEIFRDILLAELSFNRLIDLNKDYARIIKHLAFDTEKLDDPRADKTAFDAQIYGVTTEGFMLGYDGPVKLPNRVYISHLLFLVERAGQSFFDSGAENRKQIESQARAESNAQGIRAWYQKSYQEGVLRYFSSDELQGLENFLTRIDLEAYQALTEREDWDRIDSMYKALQRLLKDELSSRYARRANNIPDLYPISGFGSQELSSEEIKAVVAVLYANREYAQIQQDLENNKPSSSVKAYHAIVGSSTPSLTPRIAREYLRLTSDPSALRQLVLARDILAKTIQKGILDATIGFRYNPDGTKQGVGLSEAFGIRSSGEFEVFNAVLSGAKRQFAQRLFEALGALPQKGDVVQLPQTSLQRLGIPASERKVPAFKVVSLDGGTVLLEQFASGTDKKSVHSVSRALLERLLTKDSFVRSKTQGSRLSEEDTVDANLDSGVVVSNVVLFQDTDLTNADFSEELQTAVENLQAFTGVQVFGPLAIAFETLIQEEFDLKSDLYQLVKALSSALPVLYDETDSIPDVLLNALELSEVQDGERILSEDLSRALQDLSLIRDVLADNPTESSEILSELGTIGNEYLVRQTVGSRLTVDSDPDRGYKLLIEVARQNWTDVSRFSGQQPLQSSNNLYQQLVARKLSDQEINSIFSSLVRSVNVADAIGESVDFESILVNRINSISNIKPDQGYALLVVAASPYVELTQTNQKLYRASERFYLKRVAEGLQDAEIQDQFTSLAEATRDYDALTLRLDNQFFDSETLDTFFEDINPESIDDTPIEVGELIEDGDILDESVIEDGELIQGGRLSSAGTIGEIGGIKPELFLKSFGISGWNDSGLDLENRLDEQSARTLASSNVRVAIPFSGDQVEFVSANRTDAGISVTAGNLFSRVFERGVASAVAPLTRITLNPIQSAVQIGVNIGSSFIRLRAPEVSRVTRDVLSRVKGKDNQPADIGTLVLMADRLISGDNILDVLESDQTRTEFIDALSTWKAGISFAQAYKGNFVVQLQTPNQRPDESTAQYQNRLSEYQKSIQPILELIQSEGFETQIKDPSKSTTFIIPHNTQVGQTFDNGSGDQSLISITTYQPTSFNSETGQVSLAETTKALVFAGSANLLKAAELAGNPQPFNQSALNNLSTLFGKNTQAALSATQTNQYTQEVKTLLADFLFAVEAVWSDIKAQILQRAATSWAA